MSRLRIQHRTTYQYSSPVKFGVHRIILRPREGHRARVLHHQLSLTPDAQLTWMTDVHGNHVAYAEIAQPASELVILNEILMDLDEEREALPPARISESCLPLTWLQTEQVLVEAYCTPVWKEESAALAAWLTDLPGAGQKPSALETVLWLVEKVHRTIAYRRREERGTQSPLTTIHLGTGSCRDMATLAMESARVLGLPARFASGYLDSSVSAAGLGSTHAWLEIYFPDGGWRGFDATSGKAVGPGHIATGVSAHPRGVMPISGTFDGRTGNSLGMKVELTIRHETPPSL